MKNKNGFTLVELMILVAIVVIVFACAIGSMSTSDGSRVGIVTKLSKKGAVCKTWEATAMIGAVTQGQGGSYVPETWDFTVTDSALEDVKKAQISGYRVEFVYHQKPIFNPCISDTGYFVSKVNETGIHQ